MNLGIAILLSVTSMTESPLDGWFVDGEAGIAFSIYNDVRIPGDSGTEFSLTEDFETDPALACRLRVGRTLGERHHISLFAAPLRFEAEGTAGEDLSYNGTVFPEGTTVSASYRFDSYRLTYRYDLARSERLVAALGFTAKLRDAAIRLEGGGLVSTKSNTGLVPLVSFSLDWAAAGKLHLLIDGDALAAPQGRAEDVFLGAGWAFDPSTVLRAGCRVLEGGADNDEVYNFTMASFAVMGFSLAL